MRFINTISNKPEQYVMFKIGQNCSYFINEIKLFYLLCTCFDLNHNYTNRPGYLRPPILAVIKKRISTNETYGYLALIASQWYRGSPLEVSRDAPRLKGLVLSGGLDPALGDDPGVV